MHCSQFYTAYHQSVYGKHHNYRCYLNARAFVSALVMWWCWFLPFVGIFYFCVSTSTIFYPYNRVHRTHGAHQWCTISYHINVSIYPHNHQNYSILWLYSHNLWQWAMTPCFFFCNPARKCTSSMKLATYSRQIQQHRHDHRSRIICKAIRQTYFPLYSSVYWITLIVFSLQSQARSPDTCYNGILHKCIDWPWLLTQALVRTLSIYI